METPEAPERGTSCSLYGDGNGSINRRAFIFVATAFSALPANAAGPFADPIARARAAMGGSELLGRVSAIGWSGSARVVTGGRTLELGVETRVEPFVRARSDSWLIDEGRVEKRTMMIEGHEGFLVFKGRQVAMPAQQAAHERQQFGIYGHMLLAGIALARGNGIASAKAGYPEALLTLGRDGMPAAADYVVDSPDSAGTIRERFTFSGSVTDQGVRWPQRIAVTRNGKPFFALAIDDLTVELSVA
jgi:hypothetical protein